MITFRLLSSAGSQACLVISHGFHKCIHLQNVFIGRRTFSYMNQNIPIKTCNRIMFLFTDNLGDINGRGGVTRFFLPSMCLLTNCEYHNPLISRATTQLNVLWCHICEWFARRTENSPPRYPHISLSCFIKCSVNLTAITSRQKPGAPGVFTPSS